MPKRTDLSTILLIGSGPIVIGQGAEFDYSGTQAVKALNVAMALQRDGTLARYGVELIGANERAIRLAEDREEFAHAMRRIGLATPEGRTVRSLEEAMEAVEATRYPAILRPFF